MDVGKELSMLRKNKKLSVYKLAKLTDISENYIHEIEKGKKNPSIFILDKLLSALGITLAEFFKGEQTVLYPTSFEMDFIHTIRLMTSEKANALLQIAKYMNDSK